MIRKTLIQTKSATFAVLLPDPHRRGMPTPIGTGFFISPDGWFITAAHVITENNEPTGPIRQDISTGWLEKESRGVMEPGAMCQFVEVDAVIPHLDLALIKVDFEKNRNKDWLKGRSDFPYIQVSSRDLEEGEPVYSFGYPLSESRLLVDGPLSIATTSLSPRITSAIVSATMVVTKMISTPNDPKTYVLDKALNYGNSGGPICAVSTGHAHAFCSRFQPQYVPQAHLPDKEGKPISIMSPSLYGVVESLNNPAILQALKTRGVPIVDTE